MDSIMMLRASALLFALAAAGGLLMAGMVLLGKRNPPIWLAFGHGLLGAAGLTLLVYPAVTVGVPQNAFYAMLLLLVAAAGGAILNQVYHWHQRPLPKGLLFGHLLLAVIGFALLLTVVL